MKNLNLTTCLLLIVICACCYVPKAWGITRLQGTAELDYTKYDATVAGQEVFSGRTFAQKYSLSYLATNYYYKGQPRYYEFAVNYRLTDFNTRITDVDQTTSIHDTVGLFGYSGAVGFNPPDMPIKFNAFLSQETPLNENTGGTNDKLIADKLLYGIDTGGRLTQSGVIFAFEPTKSRNAKLYGLPRLLVDYRETTVKKSDALLNTDNRTRMLAVAGLNKENNWLNYRSTVHDNFITPQYNFARQQLQIGHVDNNGQRKWSALTNWIDVSADGQLTTFKTSDTSNNYEEYDLNLMMIATRKKWNARTFTNYNRLFENTKITESARLPVYIKGIYSADTDWYVNVGTRHTRELQLTNEAELPSYANFIAIGGTTFKRSAFTLSPSISLDTRRDNNAAEAYELSASIESTSTKRFSNTLGLAGKVSLEVRDDGLNSGDSKSWHGLIDFSSSYRPNQIWSYRFQQLLESGNGSGYLSSYRVRSGGAVNGNYGNYYRSFTMFSAGWTPSASLSSTFSSYFNAISAAGLPINKETNFNYSLLYNKATWQLHASSKYSNKDNGIGDSRTDSMNFLEANYRPDRNQDSLLRITHNYWQSASTTAISLDVLQRYNYKIFTRTGANRNLATISEEFSFKGQEINSTRSSSKYLLLSGRYSPTEKVALYGSVKYENIDSSATAFYYNAGVNADFKLLSTSLDYSYAKRDSDNRVEKKLAATVQRVF